MSQQPANILDLMKQLLDSLGITEYEPAVPHMLVELFYRHVTEVLKQAQSSCEHKKSKEIVEEDLRIAANIVYGQSSYQLPSLESLQSFASKINGQPLPSIPDVPEVILPDKETSLLEPNFQLGTQNRS